MSAVANRAHEKVLCDFWQHLSRITIILELDLQPPFEMKCSRGHPARILPLLSLCESIPKDSMNIRKGSLPSAKLGSSWRSFNNQVLLKISSSCARKGVASSRQDLALRKKKTVVILHLPLVPWLCATYFFMWLFDCIFWALLNRNCLNTAVRYGSFLSWDTSRK